MDPRQSESNEPQIHDNGQKRFRARGNHEAPAAVGCPRDGADGRFATRLGDRNGENQAGPGERTVRKERMQGDGFLSSRNGQLRPQGQEDGDKSRIRGMERKLAANCDHVAKGPGGSQG